MLGSAGGPRQALPLVGADTFLIVNGDTLTDVDLVAARATRTRRRARSSRWRSCPTASSRATAASLLDADGRVTGFAPRGPSAAGSYHFIGVQIGQRRASSTRSRPARPASSIGGVYDALIATRPGAVRGFVSDAAFWDVGTVADYWRTSHAFAARAVAASSSAGRRARIDPSARVTRSILWDDVEVGAGAVLDECIVTDGVRVPAGASTAAPSSSRGDDGRRCRAVSAISTVMTEQRTHRRRAAARPDRPLSRRQRPRRTATRASCR